MSKTTLAPFGSWRSPITAEAITRGAVSLSEVSADSGTIYWLESRPSEEGRSAVVGLAPDGTVSDRVPREFNARTSVHEYGGGSYVAAGDVLYATNFSDQRLYRIAPGMDPLPITPEPEIARGLRYADLQVTPDGTHLICVRESHRENAEAVNDLVAVPASGEGAIRTLASGRDFYASPRLTPAGDRLCWVEWDHPNLPWDTTELIAADFDPVNLRVSDPRRVAGGERESVLEPAWGPGGDLYFISDRSNWWNLYREREGGVEAIPASAIPAEFAYPMWVFSFRHYAFLDDGRIACIYWQGGMAHFALISADGKTLTPLETGHTDCDFITALGKRILAISGSPTQGRSVVEINPDNAAVRIIKDSNTFHVDPAYLSVPRPITYPAGEGLEAYGLYYPPTNPDFKGPDGEKPPLVVTVHGGPTGAAGVALSLTIQYFTSRGFGLVDVNYGGSSGYGREFRERLYGEWGVMDVEDSVSAARYLAETGQVDGARLAIRGGSAGGLTTLNALAFHKVFSAGMCYFGLSDFTLFADTTHKFEARYLDQLVGPYPEAEAVYKARSAINYVDQITAPVIWLQGLDDKIVPPSQAEVFVKALMRNEVPHAYIAFEGEGHGFRKAENIKRSIEAELSFLGQVFNFEPADPLEKLDIGI